MVKVAEALAPREAMAQFTGAAAPHVHPRPEALTKVTPAGRVSVTVTFVAALGPAFETRRV